MNNRHEHMHYEKAKYMGKQATKNAWVFTWMLFVIFIGIAVLSYIWTSDIEEWFRWTAFAFIVLLSIIGVLVVWRASGATQREMNKCKKECKNKTDQIPEPIARRPEPIAQRVVRPRPSRNSTPRPSPIRPIQRNNVQEAIAQRPDVLRSNPVESNPLRESFSPLQPLRPSPVRTTPTRIGTTPINL